jgi:hypothetical protein
LLTGGRRGKSYAMNPKGFFGELKRRNVYKVAVAYAARHILAAVLLFA